MAEIIWRETQGESLVVLHLSREAQSKVIPDIQRLGSGPQAGAEQKAVSSSCREPASLSFRHGGSGYTQGSKPCSRERLLCAR